MVVCHLNGVSPVERQWPDPTSTGWLAGNESRQQGVQRFFALK